MHPIRGESRQLPPSHRFVIVNIPLEQKTLSINGSQYTLDRKLGRGAFGAVYASRRHPDSKPVAIKVVSLATMNTALAEQNAQSVLNEIEMSKRLARTSAHIIQMYDFDFHETGLSLLVMELGQQDLEKYLSQRPLVLPAERKAIWRQLVDMAVALHNHGIVHRDVKPQNLIVFPGVVVKLADLGIAQRAYRDRSRPNGTLFYSAPEVTSPHPVRTITCKADVWSWGAVLYRMTYMTQPDYTEPCFQPPLDQHSTRDSHLRSVLRHTLVMDPRRRLSPSWLARHPYTRGS